MSRPVDPMFVFVSENVLVALTITLICSPMFVLQMFGHDPSQNGPKSGHRAPQKLSTKQSRSNKYAGADSEVEKAGCEAWGVDFEDFELHGILPI